MNTKYVALTVTAIAIVATIFTYKNLYPSKINLMPADVEQIGANIVSDQDHLIENTTQDSDLHSDATSSTSNSSKDSNKVNAERNQHFASKEELAWPVAMSEQSRKRVAAMNDRLSAASPKFSDLYELFEAEEVDPQWSKAMEQNFDIALRSYTRGYHGLEIDEVRCSRSICYVSAAVKSGALDTADNTDWQRLISNIYSEPWFLDNFMDARTTLGGDDKGAIYISTFERKR